MGKGDKGADGGEGSGGDGSEWETASEGANEQDESFEDAPPPAWRPVSQRPEWEGVVPITQVNHFCSCKAHLLAPCCRRARPCHVVFCHYREVGRSGEQGAFEIAPQDDGPAPVVKIDYDPKFVVSLKQDPSLLSRSACKTLSCLPSDSAPCAVSSRRT